MDSSLTPSLEVKRRSLATVFEYDLNHRDFAWDHAFERQIALNYIGSKLALAGIGGDLHRTTGMFGGLVCIVERNAESCDANNTQ